MQPRNDGLLGRRHLYVRNGMTVLEILVAAALALVMIIAMVQIFAVIGNTVAVARATLEMSGQLRTASHRLYLDLQGVTVPVRPWASPSEGLGYFEYVEGPLQLGDPVRTDITFLGVDPSVGDIDDVLLFTARSTGEPFVGRYMSTVIESPLAEIIWWTTYNDRDGDGAFDPDEPITLHRRALLVRPDLNNAAGMISGPLAAPVAPAAMRAFLNANDISIRPHRNAAGLVDGFVANSLADLTERENRFAHYAVVPAGDAFQPAGVGFPFPIDRNPAHSLSLNNLATYDDINPGPDGGWGVAGNDDDANGTVDDYSEAGFAGSDDIIEPRLGEDVILSNVVAFDVRVYDPRAPILSLDVTDANQPALVPGDPGYASAIAAPAPAGRIGAGAFVDLNYVGETPTDGGGTTFNAGTRLSDYSGLPAFRDLNGNGLFNTGEPFLGVFPTTPTYCTWSLHYEHDGINQDGDGLTDEGANGLDDDGANGVDDVGERETSPPYPFPLRGVQVTLRVIEPDTQQVRQTSVVTDFRPE